MSRKFSKYDQGFVTKLSLEDVRSQLTSKDNTQIINGLKNLLALMLHGVSVIQALSDVLKLTVLPDLQIRRVCYMFLLHFSEESPEQSLMAVNILQKALCDTNVLVRGMALRTLTSIRVVEVGRIAKISIQERMRDSSIYVRKIATMAIGKVFSLVNEQREDFIELLEIALADKSSYVFGAALMVLESHFQEELQLLHQNYYKIINKAFELDNYQQVSLLRLLTLYVRKFYSDIRNKPDGKIPESLHTVYRCAMILLRSNSQAVVMEVASFLFHCSPCFVRDYQAVPGAGPLANDVSQSLVKLLSGSYTANPLPIYLLIHEICKKYPYHFQQFYKNFYIQTTDEGYVKMAKLLILKEVIKLLKDDQQQDVIMELEIYLRYSMSQDYAEQQQITSLIIQILGNIVMERAMGLMHSDLPKLQEFIQHYELINKNIKYALQHRTELYLFNDAQLQQSIIEECKILTQLHQIDSLCNKQLKIFNNLTPDQQKELREKAQILLEYPQIYLDIQHASLQDDVYTIPKKVWPSNMGFQQEYDPLIFDKENEAYTDVLNDKSFVLQTRIKQFIATQILELIKLFPILRKVVQTQLLQEVKIHIIQLVISMRYLVAPYVLDLMKTFLSLMQFETSQVKILIMQFMAVIIEEEDIFISAPVYLKQRRIYSDMKKLEKGEVTTDQIISRYQSEVKDQMQTYEANDLIKLMTEDTIAEELGKNNYIMQQMQEYLKNLTHNDNSMLIRDLQVILEQSKSKQQIEHLKSDTNIAQDGILSSISSLVKIQGLDGNQLPVFAQEDSNEQLRDSIEVTQKIKKSTTIVQEKQSGLEKTENSSSQLSITTQSGVIEQLSAKPKKVQNVEDFLSDVPNQIQETSSEVQKIQQPVKIIPKIIPTKKVAVPKVVQDQQQEKSAPEDSSSYYYSYESSSEGSQ